MSSIIIGISGYARSGKDTASEALTDRGFKRMAFADALKADLKEMIGKALSSIGLDPKLYDDMVANNKELARPLMVEYGRIMRALYAPYWIDRVQYEMISSGLKEFTITDVRYENEAKMIRESGGIVIGINRLFVDPANEEERMSFEKFSPDYVIENNDGIDDLHQKVLKIVSERFGVHFGSDFDINYSGEEPALFVIEKGE